MVLRRLLPETAALRALPAVQVVLRRLLPEADAVRRVAVAIEEVLRAGSALGILGKPIYRRTVILSAAKNLRRRRSFAAIKDDELRFSKKPGL
jgi:hypothetical protein